MTPELAAGNVRFGTQSGKLSSTIKSRQPGGSSLINEQPDEEESSNLPEGEPRSDSESEEGGGVDASDDDEEEADKDLSEGLGLTPHLTFASCFRPTATRLSENPNPHSHPYQSAVGHLCVKMKVLLESLDFKETDVVSMHVQSHLRSYFDQACDLPLVRLESSYELLWPQGRGGQQRRIPNTVSSECPSMMTFRFSGPCLLSSILSDESKLQSESSERAGYTKANMQPCSSLQPTFQNCYMAEHGLDDECCAVQV